MSNNQIVAEVETQIRKAWLLECDMRDLGLCDLRGNLVQPATAEDVRLVDVRSAPPETAGDRVVRQIHDAVLQASRKRFERDLIGGKR